MKGKLAFPLCRITSCLTSLILVFVVFLDILVEVKTIGYKG